MHIISESADENTHCVPVSVVSGSIHLGLDLRICSSNKFPDDVAAELHFENASLEEKDVCLDY